jgi:4-hydroxy-tetrahydrodipicolinate synthase
MATTLDAAPLQTRGRSIKDLIGISAALLTPFGADGRVDWRRYAGHAANLLGTGMNVVTAFGTTGEGVSIPRAERDGLYDEMDRAGVTPGQLIECVYGPSSAEAGQQVRRALALGAAGILLTPPFYYKQPAEEGVYRWYAEVFDGAGDTVRDIILYNIPGLTGVTLSPALVSRLRAAYPGVIGGVKDSSGDWAQTTAYLDAHKDIAILVGNEAHLAAAVGIGASGAISGMANVAPKLVSRLVAGTHDQAIDRALDQVLALPVVPAIRVLMAVQTGEDSWRHPLSPLLAETVTPRLEALARALA